MPALPRPSIRSRLLALALLPLLGVLPVLGLILLVWGNSAIDGLLIGKVRSDLAVAKGYFERVQAEVGSGTLAVAESQQLHAALTASAAHPANLNNLLDAARLRHGFDFLTFEPAGQGHAPTRSDKALAEVALLAPEDMDHLAPGLSARARVPLIDTLNAAPTARQQEERGLVLIARLPVRDGQGRSLGWVQGGLLLNRNLGFIDHINEIVYPEGSLPFGSQGTATLFLDDVRVTTNVRLFGHDGEQRAIGTRVSKSVREAVLGRGDTWLDRAFVVKDWYVSGYLPLSNARGQRLGMLYVGYLERPFVQVKWAVLASIGALFFAVVIVAAWWSLRSAGRIYRPMERMTDTMHRVESGDITARVGPLPHATDEIARLGGTLDHLLDVVDDNTRALQRWGEELDHKVAERTTELAAAQDQLVRSEKLAAIGQLTASIAHEVNNPIAVIQGNLDLVRELLGPAGLTVKTELRLMDEQAERMRLIVTQLLQFARPGEYAGYVETLDVNEVLQASLVLVNHLLAHAGLRLVQDLRATRPVAMNRQELQQVLINLLVNAIQAMQATAATASSPPRPAVLRLHTRDIDADRIGIDVIDTGSGLSAEALASLFEPFRTSKRDGHGLGLWISRHLLERYGGTLTAANRLPEEGSGAVFSVALLAESGAVDDGLHVR